MSRFSVLHQTGTTTLDGAGYTYDAAGNRTSKTNLLNSVTENYSYDPIYQLTQVTQGATTTESYSYDAVGNRLSSLGMSPYAYNSSNELTSTPSATFTYDGNGNTATKVDANGTTTYAWDFENRLMSVALPGTGGSVTFKYDPFGRRIQKSSAAGPTNYLYDGSNSVEEIDATGGVLARYAQGAGIDEPLAAARGGAVGFYEQDGLGSVTSLSDSTASLANTYTYDAFGNLTVSTGGLTNPFQYTGRDYDSETGLRYYRARFYDQNAGRFVSEDPIRFRAGVNFYSYVKNNSPTFKDAYGLIEQCTLTQHRLTPWIPTANIVSTTPWMFKDFAEIDDEGLAVIRCRWERTVTKEIWGHALFALEYHCVSTNPCDGLRREHTDYTVEWHKRFQGYKQESDWTGNSYTMFPMDGGDVFYEVLCRKEAPSDENK